MTDLAILYERADRDVAHYQRLLAGNLSARERRQARLLLIRAVFRRAEIERVMDGTKHITIEASV